MLNKKFKGEYILYINFFILLILFLPEAQAIHWISGVVNDAPNREAKGFTIMIYHPGNKLDNVQDSIGNIPQAVEVETNNHYMLDCEMLNPPCQVGDTISVEVPEQEGYYAEPVNVVVTGAGYDEAPDMTLTKLKGKIKIATEEENATEETTGKKELEEKVGITGSIVDEEVEKTNEEISKEVLNEIIDITNQTEVKEKPEETSKSKITGTVVTEIKEAKNWLLTIFFIIIIVIVIVILHYRRKNGKT